MQQLAMTTLIVADVGIQTSFAMNELSAPD